MCNRIKYILLIVFSFIHVVFACTNCYIPIAYAGEEENYYIGSNLEYFLKLPLFSFFSQYLYLPFLLLR